MLALMLCHLIATFVLCQALVRDHARLSIILILDKALSYFVILEESCSIIFQT